MIERLNNQKTQIGTSLTALAVALGVITPEDVQILHETAPVVVGGVGGVMTLWGVAHKVWKSIFGG